MKYIKTFEHIRNKYSELGVDNYYLNHGDNYKNPHYSYVKTIINKIISIDIVDLSYCLDMSCGNGEVTKILLDNNISNIEATDPYLCKNYNKNFNFNCIEYSFDDIFNNKLKDKKYSTIFCSYALHLSNKSKLPYISWNLSLISEYIVIISPNNNTNLNNGWKLIYTDKVGKSKCKIYKSINYNE